MSNPLCQKEDLLAWVNGQRQIDTVTKFILHRLAQLADAEACAWAKVETLAEAVNKSERTIRYHLRDLEAAGLISKTDRVHRLAGSTRSVPIYQIAPGVEGFDFRKSMPAKIAAIDPKTEGYACNSEGGIPAIGLQPHNELKGTEESSYELSTGERGRDALIGLMKRLRAAYPKRALGWSDPEAAMAALEALAAEGLDLDQLPGCAERMAADPVIRRRDYGPPRLEAWLTKRQFEGWWPDEPAAASAGGATAPAFAGPPELRAAVAAVRGEAFAATYLDRARFEAEGRRLIPATGVAAERLGELRAVLGRFGVELVHGRVGEAAV